MQERTALFLRVLDPEQQPQHAAQRLRRPPHHDLHSLHLLRMQPQPQTMRSKATKNIKNPTGKIATMKIASPSASAQMPRQFHFLPHMAAPPSVRLMLHQYIRRGPVPCARQEKARPSARRLVALTRARPALYSLFAGFPAAGAVAAAVPAFSRSAPRKGCAHGDGAKQQPIKRAHTSNPPNTV